MRRALAKTLITITHGIAICALVLHPHVAITAELICENGDALASGPRDPVLRSNDPNSQIRAFWCEHYDNDGVARRVGPYRELYSNGQLHLEATYIDSRLAGPIEIRHEDGGLFARGFLDAGEWSGSLQIFHESGATWFEAAFRRGRLHGAVRTRYPDGALESEASFQDGREDGLARSFYPTSAGGRLKSEVQIEADQIIGRHRVLDRDGNLLVPPAAGDRPSIRRSSPVAPAAPGRGTAAQSQARPSLARSPIRLPAPESPRND